MLILSSSSIAYSAQETISPEPAHADTVSSLNFDSEYPHSGAQAYDTSDYEWWVDENGNGRPDVTASETDNDESMSPRGYGYRNCTDGVAYWVGKYLEKSVSGWGHAKDWDASAIEAEYTVKAGNANNIEPGDIAQSDDGGYGHVGLVTDVIKNSDGNVIELKIADVNGVGTGNVLHTNYSNRNSSGKFARSTDRDWDHFIDVDGVGNIPTARPTSPTTLPWHFETMEGDSGSMSTFNADTGQTPAATVFNNQLYVLSYEQTGGNLRLAKTTPTWNFSTLDGAGGTNGRKNADVGRTPSLLVAGDTLHSFYYDATGGNLRHGLTQDGIHWRFEDLDGTAGSILKRNHNVGQTPSAVVMPDGTIHVAYRDASHGNLILATALPGRPWTSIVLEGDQLCLQERWRHWP